MSIKVVTWNMRGLVNAEHINTIVADYDPDIICLQECGNFEKELDRGGRPIDAGDRRRAMRFIGVTQLGGGMHCVYSKNPLEIRLGLAILSKRNLDHGQLEARPSPRLGMRWPRPLPWVKIQDEKTRQHILIYSVHAPSAGTSVASEWTNIQMLETIRIANIPGVPNHWAAAGDFNANPFEVAAFAPPPRGSIAIHSKLPTHEKGKTLDYIITNTAAVLEPATLGLLGRSDHVPQCFTIWK